MHVKEQVKEFVHDVKRKFSRKHRRESNCSNCTDSHDHDGASSYSSVDTLGTLEDSSSSSAASSRPGTPERGRFSSLLHPRTSSKKLNHNAIHKARRLDGKRYRLFSAPAIPSSRVDVSISSHRQAATEPSFTPEGSVWKVRSIQDVHHATSASSSLVRDYPDVMDISSSVAGESTRSLLDSSSQTPPHFDAVSQSETSGTLVPPKESVSDFNWPFDVYSDVNSVPPLSSIPSLDQMAHPPVPPPKSEQVVPRHEDIILSVSSPSPRPANIDKPTRVVSPPQPIGPAPVYIPRLTVPSMFLPIPNVRPISPLSHPLVWWLVPWWSAGTRFSPSVSLPHFGNKASSHFQSALVLPLYSNFLPLPPPSPRR